MTALKPICDLMGVSSSKLTKEEICILEADLFTKICENLKKTFREHYINYFRLMKFTAEMEMTMLEMNFARLIINDILSTGEYTSEGIARYTDSHEDVVEEILLERIKNPSALFLRRLIELHRTIRQDLYHSIMKKITTEETEC